jgi:hypothetical protein
MLGSLRERERETFEISILFEIWDWTQEVHAAMQSSIYFLPGM